MNKIEKIGDFEYIESPYKLNVKRGRPLLKKGEIKEEVDLSRFEIKQLKWLST